MISIAKNLPETPGTIQPMPAGEVHDGISAGDDSYTLKTFRVSVDLLSGITEEITGQDQFPALGAAVLHDPSLAGHLVRLHDALQAGQESEPLEVQSEWLMLLDRLFSQTRMIKPQFVKGTLTPVQWLRVRD